MKTLVAVLGFMFISTTVLGQENTSTMTTSNNTKITTTKTLKTSKKVSSNKTTRILLESDFDRAALLFRGKKSKRVKLC
ncbi:hypothetical protein [Mangrovimonas spongiae]|uniref:Uncharacterized protein n=1 Tax=Mangrovimonas spongiae TaxID=2494697 RepID=A0A428JZZ4_9FLAO|nr:hypothetical protein [Mangrovimonas spongiae]RSK39760.1 hypothetical protein EJA19_07700 [Mangrovimonas spongiae]